MKKSSVILFLVTLSLIAQEVIPFDIEVASIPQWELQTEIQDLEIIEILL